MTGVRSACKDIYMSTLAPLASPMSVDRREETAHPTPAAMCRALICPRNADEIAERFGKRFVEYLLVENGNVSLRNTAWYMERLCSRIELGGDVLHVGCGFGANTLVVAECCGDVRSVGGVDPDAEKIGVFRKLIERLGLAHVHADIGSGENLPYDDDTFDVAICNESISHVQSIPGVLAEIHRTLRPGGRVIISDTARWNPYALWFKYGRRHLEENYQSKRRMRRYLESSGFRRVTRVVGLVAPRNPWRDRADQLWWLNRWIDPKYVLVGVAS